MMKAWPVWWYLEPLLLLYIDTQHGKMVTVSTSIVCILHVLVYARMLAAAPTG